jgi:amidase
LCLDAPSGVSVDPACRSVAETTARRCEALGHRVEIVTWPYALEDAVLAQGTIIAAHLAATVDARLAQVGRPLATGDIEPLTAAMCDRGRSITGVGYVGAIQAMHRIGRAMGALFERIDVLVTPMLGRLPVPIGTLDTSDPARFGREIGAVTPFAGLANLSLPLDEADHLPVGSQVIGRFGDEATLLRLAGQLERAHPWSARRPALIT